MPQLIRLVTWSFAAALISVASVMPVAAATEQESQVSCQVEQVPMRDGVTLATEVYLPVAPGHYPVVLTRTPYGRGSLATGSNCDNPQLVSFAQAGYVGLNQDTRGRYRSGGAFNPFQQEATDGYDAVEWAAGQPWSNGKVGLFGSSYGGVTVWQTIVAAPPHLVTAVASITASDYHDNWTYVAGAYDLHLNLGWTLAFFAADTYRRSLEGTGLAGPEIDRRVADLLATGRHELLQKWVWTLPLNSFSPFRSHAPYYYDWLAHPDYDAYWQQVDVEQRFAEVTVPVLNTGGWYDAFAMGTMRSFQGVRADGGTAAAREGTQLVMTCCGHTGTQGLIDWGPEAHAFDTKMSSGRDVSGFRRWFDHHLKGVDNGADTDPTVRLFVMLPPDTGTQGSGFELMADQYPLPNASPTRFHLQSGGLANTRHGDGTLSRDAPAGPPDRFVYDPRHPVPTMGGNLCCGDFLRRGALDQADVELREDVLVYTSPPLTEPLTVIGPVLVALSAASSAPDTDFTAKLVDVHLDGIAHNVLDRIVRARYRRGSKLPPSLITPNDVYEYTIDLGHTATVFRVGHRIRLEISSSNFPHFDRNPNTGHPFGQDAEIALASQTIYHDATHASYLELPVVSGVSISDDSP
jgi:putative CocE/NonD family hydrolase